MKSIKSVAYEGDDGANYCIRTDESNVEMIMGAQVPASGAFPRLPQGTKPRMVRVTDVTGTIVRLIPVLTSARFTAINGSTAFTLGAGDGDNGISVRIKQKIGEKARNIPSDFDSARQDGDAD